MHPPKHTHTDAHTHTLTKTRARAGGWQVSLLVAPASGFVAARSVALQQPCLGRTSPCTATKALLRMASSRSAQRDAAQWSDDAQWSTLKRLAKEREAQATRIRRICARTLNQRGRDKVAGPRHLIVLAHGLMGGTSDLSFLRDSILEADPQDTHVLLAATNQDKTTVSRTHTALIFQFSTPGVSSAIYQHTPLSRCTWNADERA